MRNLLAIRVHAAIRMPLRGIDLNSLACSCILQMRCLFVKICFTFVFRTDCQLGGQFLKVNISKGSAAKWETWCLSNKFCLSGGMRGGRGGALGAEGENKAAAEEILA